MLVVRTLTGATSPSGCEMMTPVPVTNRSGPMVPSSLDAPEIDLAAIDAGADDELIVVAEDSGTCW